MEIKEVIETIKKKMNLLDSLTKSGVVDRGVEVSARYSYFILQDILREIEMEEKQNDIKE